VCQKSSKGGDAPLATCYKIVFIGDYQMLETSQERVRLLKAGIDGKTIEKLYIIFNNFKVVPTPLLFELVEINTGEA
jgi:hypothetical protein